MHGSPPMRDNDGVPTGCLMTSIRSLCKIASKLKPLRVFWVWDGGHSKFRKDYYPEYKSKNKRKQDPEDFEQNEDQFIAEWKIQVGLMEQYLPLLGVAQIRVNGCEADDLIYLMKDLFVRKEVAATVFLATSDSDFNQLLDESFKVYNLGKQRIFEAQDVLQDFGVTPAQWVDFRAMTGDPSDNINGVHGVGEKRAADILQTFGSFANFLEKYGLETVQGAVKHYDAVYANRQIVERNIRLMDLSLLPEGEVPVEQLAHQILEGLNVKPDLKKFWNVCISHQLMTLTQESAMWKAVY